MFDNIGGKIKGLAKALAWIGIIGSVIGGFILFVIDPDDLGLMGLLVAGGGALISWISSFFCYGFGQLIQNSDILVEQNRRSQNSAPSTPYMTNRNPAPTTPFVASPSNQNPGYKAPPTGEHLNSKHQWRCSNCGAMISSDKCPICGKASGDLADKIATLNQLRKDNLITEEEYNQKMNMITK